MSDRLLFTVVSGTDIKYIALEKKVITATILRETSKYPCQTTPRSWLIIIELICWLNDSQTVRIKKEKPNIIIPFVGTKTDLSDETIVSLLIIITGTSTISAGSAKMTRMREKSVIPKRYIAKIMKRTLKMLGAAEKAAAMV
jgi:hypothetical protein